MMVQAPGLAGLRILLVEDEAMVAMMIEDMLHDLGCTVVGIAASVGEGLALANDEALSLDGAVLDINLGDGKVYPIATLLKARGVPFIFSTGYGAAGLVEPFAQTPTLAKPYDTEALELTLVSAIGARH